MRSILSILLFTCLTLTSFAQIPIPIDSICRIIKQNSIHAKEANWMTIQDGLAEKLTAARTDVDSIQSLVYVFEQLQDYHSSIIYNGRQFSHYPEFDDSTRNYLLPLVQLSRQRTGIFMAKILENNYLYLQVPGIQAYGDAVSEYAQRLSDTLSAYYTPTIRGVILDLRLNDGGQFSSMAAGLAILLGDGNIAGGVNSEQQVTHQFSLREGNLYLNNYPMTAIRHQENGDLSQLPIALLIGPNTRSSGSILAISFKGRLNTFIIGENTASGYTTGNDFFPLGNNLFLNLSTSYSVDRNNQIYKLAVPPDRILKGPDHFDLPEEDLKVREALKWLKSLRR